MRRPSTPRTWSSGSASAPASALFHADCGGHTSTAVDIWGGTSRPYLKAAADDGAARSAHVDLAIRDWPCRVERGPQCRPAHPRRQATCATSPWRIETKAGRAVPRRPQRHARRFGARRGFTHGPQQCLRRKIDQEHPLRGVAAGGAVRLHRQGLRTRRRALPGRRLRAPAWRARGPSRCSHGITRGRG